MQSTKVISVYRKEQKWDELLQFSLGEETFNLFDSWLKDKENEFYIEELIKDIPDKYLPPLLLKNSSIMIPYLIKNYKPSYATIALTLANNELKGNKELFPLFDTKNIKIILENIVPLKYLENYNIYLYLKLIEKDEYNYKNIPLKALKSKQKYINNPDIIKEICQKGIKRVEVFNTIKLTIEEICKYMSTLDSVSVIPLLERVSYILSYCKSSEDNKPLITKEALYFDYPKIFPNTLSSIFLEGKLSECSFIEQLDKNESYEKYFLPNIIDEINKKEKSQKNLEITAENMLINEDKYYQDNILKIKSYSKDEKHVLNKAWDYMLKHLKQSIIDELISEGKSKNFSIIAKSLNYKEEYDINKVSLNFDDSMDIINTTIKKIYSKKEEILSNDSEKYTMIMVMIMSNLAITYNDEVLFRSVLSFLEDDIRELLIHECIFDPINSKEYSEWTSNFVNTERLKIIIRTSNVRNIPKYLPQYICDKLGFVENAEFKINENKTLKGRISAFELHLYESKFYESQSLQIYKDGFDVYKKFLLNYQRCVLLGDKELLEDTYNINKRYNYLLMLESSKGNFEKKIKSFRLNSLVDSFSSLLSLSIGQLKDQKIYIKEICSQIQENSRIIQKDDINVPFRVALSLIQNCYIENLPSLDNESIDEFMNNVLDICYQNASNELDYSINDINGTIPLKELSNTNYKELVKQYKNCIDKVNYQKEKCIPCEAFEGAEEILEIPKTSMGRTLPIAINFFMDKIKGMKKLEEDNEKYEYLNSLHSFLKKKLYEAENLMQIDLVLESDDESLGYDSYYETFDLNLSPYISNIVEKIDKRIKYLCDSEEKLINIHNILKLDLTEEISLDKEYNVSFKLKLSTKETNKTKALNNKYYKEKKRIKENNIIVEAYKRNLKDLNKNIDKYNKIEKTEIKKVVLPEINYYKLQRNYKDTKKEIYQKFFDIFFSAEFNPDLLKKNIKSLSSLCEIISNYTFSTKYMDKISNVFAAVLSRTDSIYLLCENINKLIKK